jgi:hypothetical protein
MFHIRLFLFSDSFLGTCPQKFKKAVLTLQNKPMMTLLPDFREALKEDG